ncbi:MAG: hypothetical protein NVSMB9_03570 [Isosphaeraceae bacterium]
MILGRFGQNDHPLIVSMELFLCTFVISRNLPAGMPEPSDRLVRRDGNARSSVAK